MKMEKKRILNLLFIFHSTQDQSEDIFRKEELKNRIKQPLETKNPCDLKDLKQ